jgi:hypothetical protein
VDDEELRLKRAALWRPVRFRLPPRMLQEMGTATGAAAPTGARGRARR